MRANAPERSWAPLTRCVAHSPSVRSSPGAAAATRSRPAIREPRSWAPPMRLDHGRLGRRGAALATACSLLGTCARRASRRASLTSSTRFLAITGAPRHRDRSARPSPSRPCRRARSRPALDGNRAPPSRPPPGARRHSRRPCSTRPVWGPSLSAETASIGCPYDGHSAVFQLGVPVAQTLARDGQRYDILAPTLAGVAYAVGFFRL